MSLAFVRGLFGAGLFVFLSQPTHAAPSFDLSTVVDKAKKLAEQPYQAPAEVPQFLQELSYDQYQEIRFNPDLSLWGASESKFRVMMASPGTYYSHAVAINEIDAQGVRPVPFDKANFNFPNDTLSKRIPADLGYAGFRLTFPMETETVHNQFLSFAGASYFRGVGKNNQFGVSARGIAVDTGLRSGEEYPAFIEYWLERPPAEANSMVVYGLLNGPSVTGAYRFRVFPGEATRVEVTATLFMRREVGLLGMAPLTSMFYYGENTPRPHGEWRPQVHDSDGLLINNGVSGEWLWRPLTNPHSLRMSFLQTEDIRGFGLLQRDTDYARFEDLEARYDKRPSAWVETKGKWGKGEIVLVEIPSRSETNDNIVTFWRPLEPVGAGGEITREYTLHFGDASITGQPSAAAVQTFIGDGNRVGGGSVEGAYRVIVDFAGGQLDTLGPQASVVSSVSGGPEVEILEHFVEYSEPDNGWRLSMLVRPAPTASMSVRAYLSMEGEPLTETWTYELPPDSGVRAQGR